MRVHLSERLRPACGERRFRLRDAVGEREFELGDEQLLDVGSADVVCLFDLDYAEDLRDSRNINIKY